MRQMISERTPLKILVLKEKQLTLPSYQVFMLVSIHRLSLSLNSNYLLKEWQQILQTLWGVVGFPSGTMVKNPLTKAGDARSDPCVGKWQPTPVFLLENPMDRGAWRATVHVLAKDRTPLSTHAQRVWLC